MSGSFDTFFQVMDYADKGETPPWSLWSTLPELQRQTVLSKVPGFVAPTAPVAPVTTTTPPTTTTTTTTPTTVADPLEAKVQYLRATNPGQSTQWYYDTADKELNPEKYVTPPAPAPVAKVVVPEPGPVVTTPAAAAAPAAAPAPAFNPGPQQEVVAPLATSPNNPGTTPTVPEVNTQGWQTATAGTQPQWLTATGTPSAVGTTASGTPTTPSSLGTGGSLTQKQTLERGLTASKLYTPDEVQKLIYAWQSSGTSGMAAEASRILSAKRSPNPYDPAAGQAAAPTTPGIAGAPYTAPATTVAGTPPSNVNAAVRQNLAQGFAAAGYSGPEVTQLMTAWDAGGTASLYQALQTVMAARTSGQGVAPPAGGPPTDIETGGTTVQSAGGQPPAGQSGQPTGQPEATTGAAAVDNALVPGMLAQIGSGQPLDPATFAMLSPTAQTLLKGTPGFRMEAAAGTTTTTLAAAGTPAVAGPSSAATNDALVSKFVGQLARKEPISAAEWAMLSPDVQENVRQIAGMMKIDLNAVIGGGTPGANQEDAFTKILSSIGKGEGVLPSAFVSLSPEMQQLVKALPGFKMGTEGPAAAAGPAIPQTTAATITTGAEAKPFALPAEFETAIQNKLQAVIDQIGFDPDEFKTEKVTAAEARYQEARERLARQFGITPDGPKSGAAQRQFELLESARIQELGDIDVDVQNRIDKVRQDTIANLTNTFQVLSTNTLEKARLNETVGEFNRTLETRLKELGIEDAKAQAIIQQIYADITNSTKQLSVTLDQEWAKIGLTTRQQTQAEKEFDQGLMLQLKQYGLQEAQATAAIAQINANISTVRENMQLQIDQANEAKRQFNQTALLRLKELGLNEQQVNATIQQVLAEIDYKQDDLAEIRRQFDSNMMTRLQELGITSAQAQAAINKMSTDSNATMSQLALEWAKQTEASRQFDSNMSLQLAEYGLKEDQIEATINQMMQQTSLEWAKYTEGQREFDNNMSLQLGKFGLDQAQVDATIAQINSSITLDWQKNAETQRQFDETLNLQLKQFGLSDMQAKAAVQQINAQINQDWAKITGQTAGVMGNVSAKDLGITVSAADQLPGMAPSQARRQTIIDAFTALMGEAPTEAEINTISKGGNITVEGMATQEARQFAATISQQDMERIARYDSIATQFGLDKAKFQEAVLETDRAWAVTTHDMSQLTGIDDNKFRNAKYVLDSRMNELYFDTSLSDADRATKLQELAGEVAQQYFPGQEALFLSTNDMFDQMYGNAQQQLMLKYGMDATTFATAQRQVMTQEQKMMDVWGSLLASEESREDIPLTRKDGDRTLDLTKLAAFDVLRSKVNAVFKEAFAKTAPISSGMFGPEYSYEVWMNTTEGVDETFWKVLESLTPEQTSTLRAAFEMFDTGHIFPERELRKSVLALVSGMAADSDPSQRLIRGNFESRQFTGISRDWFAQLDGEVQTAVMSMVGGSTSAERQGGASVWSSLAQGIGQGVGMGVGAALAA